MNPGGRRTTGTNDAASDGRLFTRNMNGDAARNMNGDGNMNGDAASYKLAASPFIRPSPFIRQTSCVPVYSPAAGPSAATDGSIK
jgi:hypothetical protein